MGTKRNNAIEVFLKTPLLKGQNVQVRGLGLQDKSNMGNTTEIIEIYNNEDGTIDVGIKEFGSIKRIKEGDYLRSTSHIGENVIERSSVRINTLNFDLCTLINRLCSIKKQTSYEIVGGVKVNEVNWNPYAVLPDGTKGYFQRNFVWTLEQNQNLIKSLYNNVDCGKILIRSRSWTELENLIKSGVTEELAFYDIIDGKQRLNAIRGFINEEFTDHLGNYYSDLSLNSQRILDTTMLITYTEIDGSASDSFIVDQFLRLNFEGVPQSKEHLDFVEELSKKLK